MMGIGMGELVVILIIIMIIFGAGKLPEIGNAFGKSIKNFKQSMKEAEEVKTEEDAGVQSASTAKAEVKKEEDMIDEMAKEVKENRIDVIKTRHDGLVQDRDVFTESVKRLPFGMKSSADKGVSRDIF
ncbi:MAG: hypothetical protein A3K09_07515 [Nitrospinae bacterium RIFCSPLOWO2_12_FULL_47_7]|nr:MAG: hypothetical protein A3K09_07515 [Nitrospinae bacterium RIFCSPLOWO2_12_FULL_47_7]